MAAKVEERILFKDLIQTCSFGNVKKSLLTNYPDQKRHISGYRYVFETLRRMPLRKNKEGMKIRIEKVGRGKNQYFDVCGICAKGDNQSYALEYTSWAEWLGYEMEQRILKKMPREEIVAHCLWEMTFIGFTENQIRRRLAALKKRVKDVKEGRAKTIPYAEVKGSA
ncbi:MAG: DUF6557 family protein [Nitrospirota bacterium]